MSTEIRSTMNTNNQTEEENEMMNQEVRTVNSANNNEEEKKMNIIDIIMGSNLLTKVASICGSYAFTENGC